MRTGRIVTLMAVLTLCALSSACGSSGHRSSSSPPSSLNPIVGAALAQTSVHWTAEDIEQMEGNTFWTADVNADSGRARISWDFEGDGGTLDLVRVNDIVYVRGDSASLESFLDLKPAQAKRYAGRWISASRGDVSAQAAYGLTLPGVIHQWAAEEYSRRTRGEPLPTGFSKPLASDEVISGNFSKWNEPVHVEAPATSTPIATVRRG